MQISANGIAIEVEDTGQGEPILLLMGLGMQLVGWPQELVESLVARGFRVLRMDNRDIGLSQNFDHLGRPHVASSMMRYLVGLRVPAPYTLADMARDALGVLDAFKIERAHVVGLSMGGMIAQHMAVLQPERLSRMTLMMTTSGSRSLPQPSARVRAQLTSKPDNPRDVESLVDHLEKTFQLIGSPAYRPVDRAAYRARLRAIVTRSWRPQGTARQLIAVVADGDRTPLLARITTPTHILHGAADPLVPVAAAHHLNRKIQGSTIDVIEGMGHDLPLQLIPRFVDAFARR